MIIYEVYKFSNMKEVKKYIDYYLEFESWYYKRIKQGYKPYLNLDEINNLINKITLWYEFKYPDNYLENECKRNYLKDNMDINRLKESLLESENFILDNRYRLDKTSNSSKLFEIVFNHQVDAELRDWILKLSNFSLIYSRNSTPQYGLIRASLLNSEFSKYYQIDASYPPSLNQDKILKRER